MQKVLFCLCLICLLSSYSVDAEAYRKSSICNSNELELKNCALQFKGYKIHFLADKIIINNGVWKEIVEFPLSAEKSNWEGIEFKVLGNQKYINFLLWDVPYGESAVQSLQWYVYELNDLKLSKKLQRVVQKRSVKPGPKDAKKSFVFDKRDKFSLKKVKNKIVWSHKGKSGTIN